MFPSAPGARRVVLVAVAVLSTCAAARDLVVGQVVDYGGKFGEASRDYVAGAKVCFDLVNSRGGVNGMRIRHQVLEAASTDAAVRPRTREMLDEQRGCTAGWRLRATWCRSARAP